MRTDAKRMTLWKSIPPHLSYLGKQHPNYKIQNQGAQYNICIHIFMRKECVKNVVFRVIDSRWLFISVTMSINLHDGREKRMLAERKNASYTLKMACTLRFIQNIFDRHLHLLLNLSVGSPTYYLWGVEACMWNILSFWIILPSRGHCLSTIT